MSIDVVFLQYVLPNKTLKALIRICSELSRSLFVGFICGKFADKLERFKCVVWDL